MKGFLIKDFRFLMKQKAVFLICAFFGFVQLLNGASAAGFFISFCMVYVVVLASTSIAYDMHENGLAFLLTLPATRTTYALSKYVFALICVVVVAVCMVSLSAVYGILATGATFVSQMAFVSEALFSGIIGASVFAAITIPIYFKFGPEKSRYAMIAIAAVVMGAGIILDKLAKASNVELSELMRWLDNLPETTLWFAGGGSIFVMLAVSIGLSIRIIKRKSF